MSMWPTNIKRIQDQRGLTIVELVVAMSLAAVATAVLFSVFASTQGMYYDTRTIMENQSDTRIVMGMLSTDIRSAGSDIQQIGVQRLATCAADTVRIQSDLDANGVLDASVEPAEDVTYFYDSGSESMMRSTGTGTITLMEGVLAFTLSYIDVAGNDLGPLPLDGPARQRVRAIEIAMTVEVEGDATRDWSTTVAIRNEEDN